MRENRLSGSEGGGTEANQFLLPLSGRRHTVLIAKGFYLHRLPLNTSVSQSI